GALDELGVGPEDVALCQASAGGDLLFLEACLARGVRCEIHLPAPEAQFLEWSVLPSAHGEQWRRRYYEVTSAAQVTVRVMEQALGPLAAQESPFVRCNLWLLYSALACGIERVRFVCLWDGQGGDGPGGTAHMYSEVKRRTGRVHWIDARSLGDAM
ncbi:MAG: tetratricopeptide repeat protein, partial [Pseudomonadota bacterium]